MNFIIDRLIDSPRYLEIKKIETIEEISDEITITNKNPFVEKLSGT